MYTGQYEITIIFKINYLKTLFEQLSKKKLYVLVYI